MKPFAYTCLLLAFLLFACKKTVILPLNAVPPQIVIQGEVTDRPGPYSVNINQTINFYADNIFPPVPGAVVRLSDNLGNTDSLTETSPGVYTTHTLQGARGNTYTLSVSVNNKQYNATSVMPEPVMLDSVGFESITAFGQRRISAITYFQDPAGTQNYYQFKEYINGELFTKDAFVFDDRLSDGKYISNTLRMDSSYLNPGDQIKVSMYCIDKNVYNYLFQLQQSSGGGAFNTTASPADPESNISGGAYGYFSAHTEQSKNVVVY
ncbi:MAG: DUF4249 domain-containing protein [Puia sp.]